MKKILLLHPAYKAKDIVYLPLGLSSLAGACASQGIEARCLDLNLRGINLAKVFSVIENEDFHLIGIGGFIMQLASSLTLAQQIKKKFPDRIVILGGIQTFGCESIFRETKAVDIVCHGEAELLLPELVSCLHEQRDFSHLRALSYWNKNSFIAASEIALVADLNTLPRPKYDAFDMEFYINHNYHSTAGRRTIDFLCSRGCPYTCSYCINSSYPKKIRYRTPDNILTDLRHLKNTYQVNDFSFCDEIFTVNPRKALEICEALANEKITWLTSCRADGLTAEVVEAMKRSGCRLIVIGFEAASNYILTSMNKKADTANYAATIKLLREHGMPFLPNFMIGMPEENAQSLEEMRIFCLNNSLVCGPSYVIPFPGTKLYESIKHKIGEEQKYILGLSGMDYNRKPYINITAMTNAELISHRNRLVIDTTANILASKLKVFPLSITKILCRIYLSIFDLPFPIVTVVMHRLSNIIRKFLKP